jgi:Single-strand binding protein family
MSYLNSVMIVGFFGADPEQRQARNSGSKFTVLSVATQRSWKNVEDEWVSKVEWHRVAIFRPRLAEAVLTNIKKGSCPRRRQPRQLLRSFRRHSVLAFRLLKPSGDAGGLFGGGGHNCGRKKKSYPFRDVFQYTDNVVLRSLVSGRREPRRGCRLRPHRR